MLDAVILAVQGVLVPRSAFHHAAIEAAARSLVPEGVGVEEFRRAAHERLAASGPVALVSRTLADMQLSVSPLAQRRAVLAARAAAPQIDLSAETRQALRALAARRIVGLLDTGPREVFDRLLRTLGIADLNLPTLWAESLGGEARPGRPLPFRWLARRLGVEGPHCLHVVTASAARGAALRAGWQVWPESAPADGPLELWPLVDWLDGQDGWERATAWT